ncbi:hypothetical protein [Flagellimonas meridianipacifica]|uniref:YARHG domain-containing protein n=1 Tax=Flagellimonas meridianipacifica TaxID=1080225 RepID=A0A2T0MB88_9FLAO|nr:hypothetical protein [Allomuricauda pacifica]PRX54774.1 hypothetical protein CLV81_3178 [Allomuricauda pacifica]
MKKFNSTGILFILFLLFFAACPAQDVFDETTEFPQKCYLFNNYGDKVVFLEREDMFLSKELRESVDGKDNFRLDTVRIVKRLSENDFIIAERRGNFALMHREVLVPNSIVAMGGPIEGKSVEEIVATYNETGIPKHTPLQMYYAFSEAKVLELNSAPGLDEIKREDLITSLSWRKEIGEMLKEYLELQEDVPRYRMRRMVENYKNKKLVDLGYNPYKLVEYNWHKQFEKDEEIMKLLNAPVSFEE